MLRIIILSAVVPNVRLAPDKRGGLIFKEILKPIEEVWV